MEILIVLVAIQIILLLLKGTFLGRIFFIILKIMRGILKVDCLILSKLFKWIDKMVKKHKTHDKRKTRVNNEKKVVNGNNYDNVIQFTKHRK